MIRSEPNTWYNAGLTSGAGDLNVAARKTASALQPGPAGPRPASSARRLASIDGDTNLDGTVSFADFAILQSHFGLPGNWLDGDFDRDGVITFADFAILQNNFGASAAPTVVPEPASVTLIILAGAAMIRHRRFA